jgi:hypothetical protein
MTTYPRRGPPTIDTFRRQLETARMPKCRCGNCLSLAALDAKKRECPACEREAEEWMRQAQEGGW